MGDSALGYTFKTNLTEQQVKEKFAAAFNGALEQKDASHETIIAAVRKALLEIDANTPEAALAKLDKGVAQMAAVALTVKNANTDKEFGLKEAKRLANEIPAGEAFKVEKPLNIPKTDLPLGTMVGAAGGFGAGAALGVGDWKSVSGILKKLGLVVAGAGLGALTADDFGARTAVVGVFKKPGAPGIG